MIKLKRFTHLGEIHSDWADWHGMEYFFVNNNPSDEGLYSEWTESGNIEIRTRFKKTIVTITSKLDEDVVVNMGCLNEIIKKAEVIINNIQIVESKSFQISMDKHGYIVSFKSIKYDSRTEKYSTSVRKHNTLIPMLGNVTGNMELTLFADDLNELISAVERVNNERGVYVQKA